MGSSFLVSARRLSCALHDYSFLHPTTAASNHFFDFPLAHIFFLHLGDTFYYHVFYHHIRYQQCYTTVLPQTHTVPPHYVFQKYDMGPKTLVAAAAVATVLVASAWHNTPVTVFQPSSNNSVSDLIMKNATTYRGSFQGCDAHQMEIIQRHWTGALQLAQEPVLSDKTTPPSNAHTYDDAFFEGLAKYMTTTENLTISCVDVPFRGDQTFCDLHRKTPFSLQSSLIYGATPERLPLLLVCEDKLYTLPTFDDTPTGTSRVGAGADHFLLELVQLYAMSDIFADGGATLNLAKLRESSTHIPCVCTSLTTQ